MAAKIPVQLKTPHFNVAIARKAPNNPARILIEIDVKRGDANALQLNFVCAVSAALHPCVLAARSSAVTA